MQIESQNGPSLPPTPTFGHYKENATYTPRLVVSYPIKGEKQLMTVQRAQQHMSQGAGQWRNFELPFATVYYRHHEVVLVGQAGLMAIIPELKKTAGEVLNPTISDLVGFEVFGNCFLKLKS